MVRYGLPHRALVAALLTSTLAVASQTSVFAQQAPASDAQRRTVLVRLSNVGLERNTNDSIQVIVYTTGSARALNPKSAKFFRKLSSVLFAPSSRKWRLYHAASSPHVERP